MQTGPWLLAPFDDLRPRDSRANCMIRDEKNGFSLSIPKPEMREVRARATPVCISLVVGFVIMAPAAAESTASDRVQCHVHTTIATTV